MPFKIKFCIPYVMQHMGTISDQISVQVRITIIVLSRLKCSDITQWCIELKKVFIILKYSISFEHVNCEDMMNAGVSLGKKRNVKIVESRSPKQASSSKLCTCECSRRLKTFGWIIVWYLPCGKKSDSWLFVVTKNSLHITFITSVRRSFWGLFHVSMLTGF